MFFSYKISAVPMTSSLIVCLLLLYVTRSSSSSYCFISHSKNESSILVNTISCFTESLSHPNFKQSLGDAVSSVINDLRNATAARNANATVEQTSLLIENNAIKKIEPLPPISAVFYSLSLKNNQLVSSEDAPFRFMTSLRRLDLGYNNFTGETLTKNIFKFQEPQKNGTFVESPIQELSFAHNQIRFLREDVFEFLLNLTRLDLSHNMISFFNISTQNAFHVLKKLQTLNLANNRLNSLPESVTLTLPLREFYLNGNDFVELPVKNFSEKVYQSLHYLNINQNPIRRIGPNEFKGPAELRELHLNGMPDLRLIDHNAFDDLINLEALHCSYNPNLEFIHPEAFYDIRQSGSLKELYLNNNNLSHLFQESLRWTNLIAFDVSENPWNCDCPLKWFIDFIVERQSQDPEANLGVRCKYPPSLERATFISAANSVQCSQQRFPQTTVSLLYHMFNVIFCMVIVVLMGYVTYFIVTRSRGPFMSRPSIVVSSAQYKRVRPSTSTESGGD